MAEIKNEIVELVFPESITKHIGMWVGDTTNANLLLREVIDNSIDELYNSKADYIEVNTNNNGWYTCVDNGRGLPIVMSKKEPETTQAVIATSRLNAGSKFEKNDQVAIGLNGINSCQAGSVKRSLIAGTSYQ